LLVLSVARPRRRRLFLPLVETDEDNHVSGEVELVDSGMGRRLGRDSHVGCLGLADGHVVRGQDRQRQVLR